MAVKVYIPTSLQRLTEGKSEVELDISREGTTLIDLVNSLDKKYKGIAERVSADGKIRKFVNFYVNEEDVRFLQGEQTKIEDGYEISIIPAIAGGSSYKVNYSEKQKHKY